MIRRLTPAHQHDASCGCGHHGVGQDLQGADWKTRLGVVLAIGVRPCSGAIMILLFANALGIVSWGIAAVMSMALGTALSILGLSLLVHYARHRTVKRLATNHRPRPWLVPLMKILGGLALILFAVGLFSAWCRSAPTATLSPLAVSPFPAVASTPAAPDPTAGVHRH